MSSHQIIDHATHAVAVRVSRAATQVALVVTLLIPVSFVAFRLLRGQQLSLPEPYNNPYTIWSTACLLAFFGLAVVDFVLLVIFRRRVARPVRYLGVLAVVGSGAYIGWFVLGMLRFMYP